jgi:hypothetical protein
MLACVERLIRQFFLEVTDPYESFYNEASLQHELALYLRRQLPTGLRVHILRVHFERPASWFRPAATGLTKKEIDLAVADGSRGQVVAIELKCPRQGQHPEQMFKACQDLQFLEELVAAGFAGGVFVMHVRDPLFYERGSRAGIYAHFRAGAAIGGVIRKPTGARDQIAEIRGSYAPLWIQGGGSYRYWVQSVTPAA